MHSCRPIALVQFINYNCQFIYYEITFLIKTEGIINQNYMIVKLKYYNFPYYN
jgi:hypothetical protein